MRSNSSTLGRELDLARSFLTILQMRMGERLQFAIDADSELHDAPMPPMVLPTLVENAIKHGLSPLPEGGRIDIRARRTGEDLEIEVRDTGAGFTAVGGSGVGLANTRSRLGGLYGPRASLKLAAGAPRGVVAIRSRANFECVPFLLAIDRGGIWYIHLRYVRPSRFKCLDLERCAGCQCQQTGGSGLTRP